MSWRSWFTWLTWYTWLPIVPCGAAVPRPSFVSTGSSISWVAWGSHRSGATSDASHKWDVSRLSLLTPVDHTPTTSTTVAALSAVSGRIRLADGAALAVGDVHLLAVAQVLALDLVAEDLAVVAHADAAWFRFPDVLVGVHLTVRRAAQLIAAGLTRDDQNLGHGDGQKKESP